MDRELVERARRGDHDAFAALVSALGDRMFTVARLILRDVDRAEDAVQEALVRTWRELPGLRDPDRFEAWVRRLVVNACHDESRKVRRRSEVTLIPLDGVGAATRGGRTDRTTDDRGVDDRDQLERGFRRLPVDQRAVLVLHHYVGLPLPEVAEALGVPLGTAKSRLHYATRAMRAALDADERGAIAPVRPGRTA